MLGNERPRREDVAIGDAVDVNVGVFARTLLLVEVRRAVVPLCARPLSVSLRLSPSTVAPADTRWRKQHQSAKPRAARLSRATEPRD